MFRPIFHHILVLSLFLQPFLQAEGISSLFPKNIEEMRAGFETTKKKAEAEVGQILLIDAKDRTFENTALALDKAEADFNIFYKTVSFLKLVHPNPEMRMEAEKTLVDLNSIDPFASNLKLYEAIASLPRNSSNPEREYYLSDFHSSMKREGILFLSPEDLEQKKRLQNKITALSMQFQSNIDEDESVLFLKKEELLGLSEPFIQTFAQIGDEYIVLCTPNTVSQILRNSKISSVRQKCFQINWKIAFPQNLPILKELIDTRHKLALLLGYKNFAELSLSSQMAKTPERVLAFIQEWTQKNNEKIQNNWKLIVQDIPESVAMTPDGKVNPWDVPYLLHNYSKKHFDLDSTIIAEYFPFQSTLEGILDVFSQFFSLEFQIVPQNDLWDPSAFALEVKDEGNLIGHIVFDLFPRKNKFSGACCCTIIPPLSKDGGKTFEPALAAIVTNLSEPPLLRLDDITNLLHEFGHALHALLGRSELPSQAANYTPKDFAEAPSQLLEEWSFNPIILKKISRHYQTGEPLPDFMIDDLQKERNFDVGGYIENVGFALFSLRAYEGTDQDLAELNKEIYQSSPQIIAYTDVPYYCSCGHLADYGPRYYCYDWSKLLALQMFDYIMAHGGPLDPAMGKRYRSKVIGRGGSADPNELMSDFLQKELP